MFYGQEDSPSSKAVPATFACRFATFEAFASQVLSNSLVQACSYFVYSEVPPDWGERVFVKLDRNEQLVYRRTLEYKRIPNDRYSRWHK